MPALLSLAQESLKEESFWIWSKGGRKMLGGGQAVRRHEEGCEKKMIKPGGEPGGLRSQKQIARGEAAQEEDPGRDWEDHSYPERRSPNPLWIVKFRAWLRW